MSLLAHLSVIIHPICSDGVRTLGIFASQRTGIGLHRVSTVTALNPAAVAGSVALAAVWAGSVTDGIVKEVARTAAVATINAAQVSEAAFA